MAFKCKPGRTFLNLLLSLLISFGAFACLKEIKATELPASAVEYIQKNYPDANIRFDGLIELTDGTIYVPVLPVVYADHEGPLRVTMSLPEANKTPDLLIFSNNLSLLKLKDDPDGGKTFINGPEVPLKVKLGLLPEDLVVPEGLKIPEDLKSILGNLVIPVKKKTEEVVSVPKKVSSPDATTDNADQPEIKPLKPAEDIKAAPKLPVLNTDALFGLGNRLLYLCSVTGNSVYVVDPQLSKVIDTIKVAALPIRAVLSANKKHLFVVCLAANSIASVDLKSNKLENLIKVGLRPTNIVSTPDGSKIFVANTGSGTISVVNTDLFEVTSNIEVQGMPEGIVPSNDNRSFYMYNRASGIVSKWDSLNPENRQFLFMVKNPCAIAINPDETLLYVSSRSQNNVMIYNLTESRYEGFVEVGKKPLDIVVSQQGNFIYVLEAGEDKITVIDSASLEVVDSIELMSGGFPNTMTPILNQEKVIVTNAESDKLTLVDLAARKVITTIPIGVTSKSLTIGPTPLEQKQAARKLQAQPEEQSAQ